MSTRRSKKDIDRDRDIVALVRTGLDHQAVADRFGLPLEQVDQIVNKAEAEDAFIDAAITAIFGR